MKHCWKCDQDKDDEEFPWRNKREGKRDGRCKLCQSKNSKAWYTTNRERRLKECLEYQSKPETKAAREARRQSLYAEINKLKSGPCMDCGHSFSPWVMEFDHRDPATKRLEISYMVPRLYRLDTILEEVAKCDLVCSNCHAERTHNRRINQWP